jgi:hypothetical protein
MIKCNSCGEKIKENGIGCDWQQGRCPHRPSTIDIILSDPYKARYLNLINSIKGLFRRG